MNSTVEGITFKNVGTPVGKPMVKAVEEHSERGRNDERTGRPRERGCVG